jgi:hypothetical protein
MKAFHFLFICFIFSSLLACSKKEDEPTAFPEAILQYDTIDLVLHSRRYYSSYTPWFNPFTQISLSLELESPSGQTRVVPGFFDGDGLGSNSGRVFKFRLSPNEPGMWNWNIASNLDEFNQQTGSFSVAGKIDGLFNQGPISIYIDNPKMFAFENQTPFFLIGKFLDKDQPIHLRYTHTLFSEQWSNTQRGQLVDHQLSMGVNKINIYLANKGDYGGIATTPWLGTTSFNTKSRFDLRKWHQYEKWVKRLRNEGIVAQLWFFADDSNFGSIKEEERNLLIS